MLGSIVTLGEVVVDQFPSQSGSFQARGLNATATGVLFTCWTSTTSREANVLSLLHADPIDQRGRASRRFDDHQRARMF